MSENHTPTVEQLAARLTVVEEQVNQLLVRALVTQVDGETYRVKVKFPAQDDVESDWLQVLTVKSQQDKYYALPDIDDQVMVLNLPGAQDVGYVLGTFYSLPNPPPVGADSPDITMVNWGEGTFFKHDRASGDVEMHVAGKLTLAVVGDIDIGSTASIHVNSADQITVKAPNEITLGGAETINVNATTSTNIVGSTFLTCKALATADFFSAGMTSVTALGSLSLEAGAMADLTAMGSLTMSSGTDAKLSAGESLHCNGKSGAHYDSGATTSVHGKLLLLGAAQVQTSGTNLVEQAEVVTATAPPIPAEPTTPGIPIPPLATAAALPPDTVPAPQPIAPAPYRFDPPPQPGDTPEAPGPVEGPTSKEIIQ